MVENNNILSKNEFDYQGTNLKYDMDDSYENNHQLKSFDNSYNKNYLHLPKTIMRQDN